MRVLIATDGSDFSQKAIEKLCELFDVGQTTEFKIISVVEHVKPMVAEPFGASTEYYLHVEADLRKGAKKTVEAAREYIEQRFPNLKLNIICDVYTGNVKKIIVDECERFGANLVAVGSHGYGFVGRMLLGSVSDYVIHHAPCSVIVLRSDHD